MRQVHTVRLCADDLRELRARERKLGIQPDPDLDGFQKAAALHGQRSSPITLFIMRLLGLEVPDSIASSGISGSTLHLTIFAGGDYMGTALCLAIAAQGTTCICNMHLQTRHPGKRSHLSSAHASSMWMQVCAGTKIGNNMIRGVSGGQRKRVTTGYLPVAAPHKA